MLQIVKHSKDGIVIKIDGFPEELVILKLELRGNISVTGDSFIRNLYICEECLFH